MAPTTRSAGVKLTIKLSGLFLFVRRGKQLFVLAPQTGPSAKPQVEAHEAKLQVYRAFENGTGAPKPDECRLEDFNGFSIEIGDGKMPSATTGSLSRKLAHVGNLSGGTLRDLLETTHDRLTSRIILNSGKQCGSIEGARFLVRGSKQYLTTEVYWTIKLPDNSVTLNMVSMKGQVNRSLTLSTDQKEMCLGIFHVPHDHLPCPGHDPKKPDPNTMSPHFIALYSLYEGLQDVVIPIYIENWNPGNGPPSKCSWCDMVWIRGGDPVTCVGGEG